MSWETLARLSAFAGLFLILAFWETAHPFRPLTLAKWRRWGVNLSMMLLNTLAMRLIFFTTIADIAAKAESHGWGILNHASLPVWMKIGFAVLALDFVVYLQHILFHAMPVLWRFHMVHHADLDFDLTTGIRFHPMEIMISFAIKALATILLGASPPGVVIFEVVLNGTAMFNHSNISLPGYAERWARRLVVTPDMHRIHHSVIPAETNSNFGFNLALWDRVFRTYRHAPQKGQSKMEIGLKQFRDPSIQSLLRLLALPFSGAPGEYPLISAKNRR